MKHYKDQQNNLYAYEPDGSQDHLIPQEYVQISHEEAEVIRAVNSQNAFNSLPYSIKR